MQAQRLRPIAETYLQTTQYCGVPGNNILDAAATVRDTTAYAENNIPMCPHSISKIPLIEYPTNTYFRPSTATGLAIDSALIQSLHTDVNSAVLINGDLHGPIPICCGVRQGCPLSMTQVMPTTLSQPVRTPSRYKYWTKAPPHLGYGVRR